MELLYPLPDSGRIPVRIGTEASESVTAGQKRTQGPRKSGPTWMQSATQIGLACVEWLNVYEIRQLEGLLPRGNQNSDLLMSGILG